MRALDAFASRALRETCPAWKRIVAAALLSLAAKPFVFGQSYYLATDVPSTLDGADYTTDRLALSDKPVYVPAAALPTGIQISALHRRADGVWLMAPAQRLTSGETDYEPRDVVSIDGTNFAVLLDVAISLSPGQIGYRFGIQPREVWEECPPGL